jgi:hypothetical protein
VTRCVVSFIAERHRIEPIIFIAALHSSTPATPKISERWRRNGCSQILYGFPRSKLNWNKKLLRRENFATHPFTAPMSRGYFLPDFMKLV